MFGAEREKSAGEVRLVPVSEEQRDALAAATDALDVAWGIIANAGRNLRESDDDGWPHESEEWVEAATRWRDEYWHPLLDRLKAGGERPSVSLREGETVDAAFVRIAYETWEALHDGDPNRPVDPYSRAVGELCEIPVEREAEEGERGMRDPSGFGMCIACDMPVERVGWDDLCLACQEDDDDNTEFEEDKDSDA